LSRWCAATPDPLLWTQSVHAHGIAGSRYFAGTITFDDPAVADELILPDLSYLDHPAHGSNVAESRINGAFARLLTPTLAFTIDSAWGYQNWPAGHTSGFDKADIGLKYEAYRDNRHETLVSASLAWICGARIVSAVGLSANGLRISTGSKGCCSPKVFGASTSNANTRRIIRYLYRASPSGQGNHPVPVPHLPARVRESCTTKCVMGQVPIRFNPGPITIATGSHRECDESHREEAATRM
jgi:hypothetical protein